jgi:hypothetical protein
MKSLNDELYIDQEPIEADDEGEYQLKWILKLTRQLSKMAGALAYEGREALDRLGDVDYYLWFIEAYGTERDMENAGIEQEEEE